MKNLLSISDLSKTEILDLISQANEFVSEKNRGINFILGILFLEESTRTRVGFEVAAYRLGGKVSVISQTKYKENMSVAESVEDTFRVFTAYTDILCVRDYENDRIKRLVTLTDKPTINCGNGTDEHPTQALIDLLAINNFTGRLENLKIALVGDLLHMRTAHSLLLGLSKFSNISIKAISPKELRIPDKYKQTYLFSNNQIEESEQFDIRDCDVVYMTGFAPKTPVGNFSEKIRLKYQLNIESSALIKKDAVVLCPLPRIDEVTREVDDIPQAKYFEQSKLGLYMRMAVINSLLKS